MTDQPLTPEAATNRLLVAAYEHCMGDVASVIDGLVYTEPWELERQDLENVANLLRSMLAKAQALKTVQAGDKVEALLALAGQPTEKTYNGLSAEEFQSAVKRSEEAEVRISNMNTALDTLLIQRGEARDERDKAQAEATNAEAALAAEKAKRVDAEAEVAKHYQARCQVAGEMRHLMSYVASQVEHSRHSLHGIESEAAKGGEA